MATVRNNRTYAVKVGPAATPWRLQQTLTVCDTFRGILADRRRQSALSQTTSCLRYFVGMQRIATKMSRSGNGIYLCTYVEDGVKSYLGPQFVSICKLSARPQLLSGSIWDSGQPFLSVLNITPMERISTRRQMKTISFMHSNKPIVFVMSCFI